MNLFDPIPDIFALFEKFDKLFFEGQLACGKIEWSPRMTVSAGICYFDKSEGPFLIRLSKPLLKDRPRKDIEETMLHEMIHAYLFVTKGFSIRNGVDGHGPMFQEHMRRINIEAGTDITIYHSFYAEVDSYKQHWWRCNGPCRQRLPYLGLLRRSRNRTPGPNDFWWRDHEEKCGGTYEKIKEPEGYEDKKKKTDKHPVSKKSALENYFAPSSTTSRSEKIKKPDTNNATKSPALKMQTLDTYFRKKENEEHVTKARKRNYGGSTLASEGPSKKKCEKIEEPDANFTGEPVTVSFDSTSCFKLMDKNRPRREFLSHLFKVATIIEWEYVTEYMASVTWASWKMHDQWEFYLEINIDNPDPANLDNGPPHPHVGYGFKELIKDDKWRETMVDAQFAYHVTNVEHTGPSSHPNYSKLEWSLAMDPDFDRKLVGLPCIFFSTTLYNTELPKSGPYPRKGKLGHKYWRVKVPMHRFNEYSIFYCRNPKNYLYNGVRQYQVRLVLVRNEEAVELLKNIPDIVKLNTFNNPFLCLDGGRWKTNNYWKVTRPDIKYWVNFVVLGDFQLDECEWDGCKRNNQQGRELDRENQADQLIVQWANHQKWSGNQ
ncbi:unnamed protein product, partial [Mesorhabditis belari]|uniref:SprT-like domain-containing protein n=1 Tax=Mesorhabditis belari TaxID=2138241 RepID=A0AAF3EBS7_9BILA